MIKDLIYFSIDPFNLFWLLMLVTMGCWFFKKMIWARRLGIFTVVLFLLISTPLVPTILINSLEKRYEPLSPEELTNRGAPFHIVVLGGGHGIDEKLPANSLLSLNALGRLNEGIRLQRKLPNSKLVVSGHSSHGPTHAELLQQAAVLAGLDEESITLQKPPVTTYDEARVYAENYGNTHPVILVTSASHMPRAVQSFRFFDIEPVPSPTDFRLKGSWKGKWFGL